MTFRGHPLQDVAQAVGGELIAGSGEALIEHLSIDSRKPSPLEGTLFIALRGEHHDGHRFIAALHQGGIRNFLVEDATAVQGLPGVNAVRVKDALDALQRLTAWHRAHFHLPVVGITGSNGKTVVKEWLFQLLREKEHIVRSPGSWNSQVGVPLSVWGIAPEHSLGIFEAGISKPGEMEKLRAVIRPTIGIFTNLGPAHGENFANDRQKALEKGQLFRDAKVLVHCADQATVVEAIKALELDKRCLLRDWSRGGSGFLRVIHEERTANGTLIRMLHDHREFTIELPFADEASVENVLHCITLLLHLGHEPEWIGERVRQLQPVGMRLQMLDGVEDSTLINDAYSNDLASLRIALDHLAGIAQGRDRIAVISDIHDSGEQPERLYSAVAGLLQHAHVKRMIGIGPMLRTHARLFPEGSHFYPDAATLLKQMNEGALHGAVVLIKGARAFGLEEVVRHWQRQVHGTVLQIDLDAVRHNLNHYRGLLAPEVKVMAMVKAFGYGSGALELARLFAHEQVHYLGVAYVDEGIELRQNGIRTPVMVMNPEPVPLEALHRFGLEAVVYDLRSLREMIGFSATHHDAPPVHVKLDTGMHRLGFTSDQWPPALDLLRHAPHLRVASVFSHLAASEDPRHDDFTRAQIEHFRTLAAELTTTLGYKPLWHLANSGGVSRFPEAHFDMVRLGIGLHGIGVDGRETTRLHPAASLSTPLAQIKRVPRSDTIGYGRSFSAPAEMRIAVLPIGYADGLSRRLGNGQGRVWIHGKAAPFVGTICMDMCMVDVTNIPCTEGDDAFVFDREHPIAEFARDLGTIPYEALTSISQRVKRVYTHG